MAIVFMHAAHSALCLLVWASLSVAVSVYNKWILGRLAFNFPILLSFLHMSGSAAILNVYVAWFWTAPGNSDPALEMAKADAEGGFKLGSAKLYTLNTTSTIPPPAGQHAPPGALSLAAWIRQYGRYIFPVATMFASSVCLRNSAFARLPLPVMQLLGSAAPLGTYVLSVAVGLVPLALPCLCCMAVCMAGVAIAIGDKVVHISTHTAPLARHATGILLEVCRSIVLQLLIRKITAEEDGALKPGRPAKRAPPTVANQSTQPPGLSTTLLAAYAPICAAMLAVPAASVELCPALQDAVARPPLFWAALLGNVATALALNMAALTCLQRVGVVSLSLTGFLKDWGLVALSTAIFGLEVSTRFVVGMTITTVAVVAYTYFWRKLTQ